MDLDYLQALESTHEEWMPDDRGVCKKFEIPYVRVHSKADYESDEHEKLKIVHLILTEIVKVIPAAVEEHRQEIILHARALIRGMTSTQKSRVGVSAVTALETLFE